MKRIFINAIKNIRRSPYQSIAAVLILTLSLFITQLFFLISYASGVVIGYFETRPQVTAFFKDEVNETVITNLKTQFEAQDYVSQVVYVSKEEALNIYREQNADDPLLLEMVTADILPASLEISATSIDNLDRIAQELSQTSGVEEVAFQTDVIDALKKWTRGIKFSGLILVSFLSFTSIMIISIIISIKASAKKQEIITLRLLGAGPLFISGPFIIEGALYGIFSSLIAWMFTLILTLYATPTLVDFFEDIPLLPIQPAVMFSILIGSIAVASIMGMVSGSLSTRKFNK